MRLDALAMVPDHSPVSTVDHSPQQVRLDGPRLLDIDKATARLDDEAWMMSGCSLRFPPP
jgi:hypothetical protein